MARLPPQPRPARDDASLRGDAADDRRRARGQRATTKTPPSGMTLPRKPTPSHRRRRRPGARRAGPRRPGRAVHETRDGARPPSGDAIYWSWLCIWPSRGRRQQSNAAKLSRNGARTAEIGSRRLQVCSIHGKTSFGTLLARLDSGREQARRRALPRVAQRRRDQTRRGAPRGAARRRPLVLALPPARRAAAERTSRPRSFLRASNLGPSVVLFVSASRGRHGQSKNGLSEFGSARRGASTSGSGRRVSGHAAIAGALRGHGRLRRARQGHGRLAARRRGRPAERNRFCPGFLRRP